MDLVGQLCILAGSLLVLVSSIGLHRFDDVFARLHAAGKATSLGFALVAAGAIAMGLPGRGWGELILAAVVHFVPDERDPWGLLRRYKDALAPGSYVALSHGTTSRTSPELVEKATKLYSSASAQLYMRSEEDIERLFEGLELVPPYPGAPATLTYAGLWGAEVPEDADSEGSRYWLCGVGRKP